jgi:hypothetical protein
LIGPKECADDIANLRAIEEETLRERYRVTIESRLALLAGIEKCTEGELSGRKLDTIPAERLVMLVLRCHEALSSMIRPVGFKRTGVLDLDITGLTSNSEWEA